MPIFLYIYYSVLNSRVLSNSLNKKRKTFLNGAKCGWQWVSRAQTSYQTLPACQVKCGNADVQFYQTQQEQNDGTKTGLPASQRWCAHSSPSATYPGTHSTIPLLQCPFYRRLGLPNSLFISGFPNKPRARSSPRMFHTPSPISTCEAHLWFLAAMNCNCNYASCFPVYGVRCGAYP